MQTKQDGKDSETEIVQEELVVITLTPLACIRLQ